MLSPEAERAIHRESVLDTPAYRGKEMTLLQRPRQRPFSPPSPLRGGSCPRALRDDLSGCSTNSPLARTTFPPDQGQHFPGELCSLGRPGGLVSSVRGMECGSGLLRIRVEGTARSFYRRQ